jgi:hypothetical protein
MEIVSLLDKPHLVLLTNSSLQRETNVLPSNLPSHSRNPKVQHSRLQTTVCHVPIALFFVKSQLMTSVGWSSSKKPSAKCAKSSACENNAAMPSHKQTSRRHAYYKLTIPHENVAAMEKWRARGRKANDLYALYDAWVFYCIVFFRERLE